MKEFAIYTGLRLSLFAGTFGIVAGLWLLVEGRVNVLVAVLVGFVVSGVGSYFLLDRQREALAQKVDERARRATRAFEDARAKEDAD